MALIDDFETDLSDWQSSGAYISTDHAYTGSSSVFLKLGSWYIRQATPSVPFGPGKSARFYIWPWFTTSDLEFQFGFVDSDSHYSIYIRATNSVELIKYVNGSRTVLAGYYSTGPNNSVFSEIKIDWSESNQFTVYTNGTEKLSATDTTSEDGTFRFTDGYYVWVDDFYIESLGGGGSPSAPTGLTLTQL